MWMRNAYRHENVYGILEWKRLQKIWIRMYIEYENDYRIWEWRRYIRLEDM